MKFREPVKGMELIRLFLNDNPKVRDAILQESKRVSHTHFMNAGKTLDPYECKTLAAAGRAVVMFAEDICKEIKGDNNDNR